MSLIASLQRELQEAVAAEARATRTAAVHPDLLSVQLTLLSIQKRRENLEQQFVSAASEIGLDICSYRLELGGRRATIAAVTTSLNLFQKVFSAVYDAILHGKKKVASWSAEVTEATTLDLAYTFPGSLGFMMTIPNDRLLLGPTNLDDAMRGTFDLLSSPITGQVDSLIEQYGVPAARFAHQWALENSKAGFGADISWERLADKKFSVRLQPQEVSVAAIAFGNAMAVEQVQIRGELLDVKMSEHTFQMRTDERMIVGSFDKAISEASPAQIPHVYIATLRISTKVASEKDRDIAYFLVSLDEPPALSVGIGDEW